MTTIQICALIATILATAFVYWLGYRGGLADGQLQGRTEDQEAHSAAIRDLESELRFINVDRSYLTKQLEQLSAAQAFGARERQTLIAAAEKLRLASDTFRAMSSKDQARQALELRAQVLDMIALLQPAEQERAA